MSVITNTFLYYPVSAILWFWHKIFGLVLNPAAGITWALSVVFLVFTLRVALLRPFIATIKTTKKMQELQPKMAEIKKKYGKDRQKYALEIQKLQREQGFNPLMGCLPVLLQVPIFIGLYHVLSSFNRTGTGLGQIAMTPEQTRNTPNYIFNVGEVQSFLDARFFGVPLSSYLTQPAAAWKAFYDSVGSEENFSRMNIFLVIIPIALISAIATHLNSRAAISRQSPEVANNQQTAIMNFLSQWIFPLGVIVMAPFMPIANLLYWLSNNIWTYGQQVVVFKKLAKEEEFAKKKQMETQAELAPRPGVKPNKGKNIRKNNHG